jgi:hypothetical protein
MSSNSTTQNRRVVSPDDFKLPDSITQGKKIRPEKYMVLQMGQGDDDS